MKFIIFFVLSFNLFAYGQIHGAIRDHVRRGMGMDLYAGAGWDRITFLDLRGKGIMWVNKSELSGLTSLRRLDLSNNNLTALSPGVFSDLPSLKWLDLSNNPLPQAEKDRIRKALPHVDVKF